MGMSNIIVLGPSGVGKSTLINAVIGDEISTSLEMSKPYVGTNEIQVHESEDYNIRLIDTVGFEPSAAKQKKAVNLVQKWTKDGAKKKDDEKSLDLVWFCIDGTSKRVFSSYIENFVKAVKIWKGIPVIVVVTKSYSALERHENVEEIRRVFEQYAEQINLKYIIPVVALPYNIKEDMIVNTSGLQELMDRTLEVLPEGHEQRRKIQSHYSLGRKRIWSRGITLASVAAAVGIGLTKVDFPAAKLLGSIEKKLVDQIAKQYEISDDEHVLLIKEKLITSGTVGVVAKKAAELLNKVPSINVKGVRIDIARVANGVVAGSIVAGIGESSRFVFEKIYLHEETKDSLEWIDKFLENDTSVKVVANIKKIWANLNVNNVKNITPAVILTAIKDAFFADEDDEKNR